MAKLVLKEQKEYDKSISQAFECLRFRQELTANQREAVEKMADKFTTCTLSPAVAGYQDTRVTQDDPRVT